MYARTLSAAGKGARGTATVGQGKAAQPSPASTAYRAAHGGGEQYLVAHLGAALGSAFPHELVVTYYVSLKTNPFVVLTGREGVGKAAFAAGFADALVGLSSGQFVTIGSDSWARRGAQSSYYRGIHERFGANQFLEMLQEAAAPESAGKVYLLLLKGLTLEELHYYVNQLLTVDANGERRLALPGVPPPERPVVPPNCFFTATLHLPRLASPLDQEVLRHAGQIEFGPDVQAATPLPAMAPPPVGLQRLMLSAACHDPRQARVRLTRILGRRELARLGPSSALTRRLLENGIALDRRLREDTLAYVANSFDANGCGLFDPSDSRHNASLAYNAQLTQRLL